MKAFKLSALFLIILLLAFQSCKSVKDIPVVQLQGKWILKTFEGKGVAESFKGKIPTMELNITDKSIFGNSGCNRYTGQFTLVKNQFSAPNLGSTMMMCTEDNKEPQFLQALGQKSTLSVAINGDLIFTQNGKQIMVFSRAKSLTVADLSGVWTLQFIQGTSADTDFGNNLPTIEFSAEDGRVSGNAGCNRYNATFVLADDILTVTNPVTTRRACERLAAERTFIGLLSSANDIELDGDALVLRKGGVENLRFVKK